MLKIVDYEENIFQSKIENKMCMQNNRHYKNSSSAEQFKKYKVKIKFIFG